MRKKLLVLTVAVVTILILQSCKIPTAIEITGSPDVSVPVHSDAGLSDMITEALKGSELSSGDTRLLKYTGYVSEDGKNLQAFLLHMQYNFDIGTDYGEIEAGLAQINDLGGPMDSDLSQTITIGNKGNLGDSIGSMDPIAIDLAPAFNGVRADINDKISDTAAFSTPPLSIAGSNTEINLNPPLTSGPIVMDAFDTLEIGAGQLKADITLNVVSGNPSDIRITLGDFAIGGEPLSEPVPVDLTGNQTLSVAFDLAGKTLGNDFAISVGSFTDNSTTTGTATLEIELQSIDGLKIREITGVAIAAQPVSVSQTISPTISLDGFVHAQIGTGTLGLKLAEAGGSRIDGVDITPHMNISQTNSGLDDDGNTWPGINIQIDTNPGNIDGEDLNKENISIGAGSTVTIASDSAAISLSPADMNNETVSMPVQLTIDIGKFEKLHVNMDDFLPAENDKPQMAVPPQPLGEAAGYIETISFDKAGVLLTFGRVDIANLAIMIHEPNLGINPNKEYKPIPAAGGIVDDFIRDDENLFPVDLPLQSGNDELQFEVEIRPAKIDSAQDGVYDEDTQGNVIEIQNFSPTQETLQIRVESGVIVNDWKEARLKPDAIDDFTGRYPEQEDAYISELSKISETLKGFAFNGVQTRLYTRGPATLFKLNPELTMEASYTDAAGVLKNASMLPPDYEFEPAPQFDVDPQDTGEYAGTIPDGGASITIFEEILNTQPDDLCFRYELQSSNLTIYPDTLENLNLEGPMTMEILSLIPMSLIAGPDAKIILPSNSEGSDLFDREAADAKSILDWINSLSVKIELSDPLLAENGKGEFYMDDNIRPIKIPLTGKAITVSLADADLKYINDTWPYKPEMGIAIDDGTKLDLVQGLGIATVDLNADISHRIDLQDIMRAAEAK